MAMEEAFSEFLSCYPQYKDTLVIDQLRQVEYPHLNEKDQVCLDYTGVGIFSSTQKSSGSDGGFGIALSYISLNLATHAMYVDDNSVEGIFRRRILRYLSLDEDDYYIVFTANALSAFKLLGESYPFHEAQNLLHAYDHVCENVDAIVECAQAKGAFSLSVNIQYPCFKMDSEDIRKKLQRKRKIPGQKSGSLGYKGLFAYPYSSRVTGCRNSSQWIAEAQQNGWHVLLDVTSADPKMFDSLGLSLFRPDFLICSFYTLFGEDPSGFAALAVKKSVLRTLGDSFRARAIGMVEIVSKQSSSPSTSRRAIKFTNDLSIKHTQLDRGNNKDGSNSSKNLLANTRSCWTSSDKSTNGMALIDPWNTIDNCFVYQSSSELLSSSSKMKKNNNGNHSSDSRQRSPSDSWDMYECEITVNATDDIMPCTSFKDCLIDHVALCFSNSEPAFSSHEAKQSSQHQAAKTLKEINTKNVQEKKVFCNNSLPRLSPINNEATKSLKHRISGVEIAMTDEPYIPCKGLDHADMLGYVKISTRLRTLASWLTLNLLKLKHNPPFNSELVRFYSQISPSECGSTIAFSLLDSNGNCIEAKRVQMLADRHSISIRTGQLEGIPSPMDHQHENDDKAGEESILSCVEFPNYKRRPKGNVTHKVQLPVNCISLSFLNNFSDAFRLWQFVSKFLEPEFVQGELWHYQALNQETIQI